MFRASRFTSSPIVRLTCLALCFALVLSGVSFAVSGRSKKKSGGGAPGSNSAAQRTQGPPSPNLPNLDAARRIKPAPPKAPNPVPATKCRRRDKACKKAKGETAINQPQFTNDGPDRLIARVDNHSWSNRFTASEKTAGRDFSIPAVDALLDKPNRAVLDSPVGDSHRHNRDTANLKTAPAAAPGFMMQGESDLAAAQLDPNNRKGTPGEDLLSRNFNWSLSLLSIPGRAGLDLGLGISFNSLVWTKVGSVMQFDLDWGTPTPGFRLGFPTIQRYFFNPQAGAYSYLLILPSGRHVELRQIGTNVYEAVDSSYLHLTYNPSDYTLTLRTTDGTQLKFQYQADEWKCIEIKDRNGNYITINYGAGYNGDDISAIVDTLGRVITFNYDTYATVTSITQTWGGQTHTWATFAYGTQTIQTNFIGGLTMFGASNGSVISVLKRVGLADGSVYSFEYNTYCQVKTIRRYAPNTSNPVTFPNDYFQRAYTTYDLPDNTGPAQSDCPRFTTRTDWAYEWNTGVTSTFAPATPNWAWGEVTMPDGTVYKETFATSGWQRGLTTQAETKSGGVAKKWTVFQWTQDNTGVSYRLNPRIIETNVYDDAGARRRTVISYTPSYGLPMDVYEYEANATTVLRRTHTDHNLSSAYTNRRIIGLPNAHLLYDGGGSLFSKVEYYYDESGFVGPDRLLQSPPAAPIRHDGANYGNWQDGSCPSCVHERGNLTTVRRYNVVDSSYVETKMGYHTTGSPYFTGDPLGHKTRTSYQDSFSDLVNRNTFAYPTTLTDADSYSSTIQYSFDHGAVTRTQDPKGAVFTRDYDTAGRLSKVTNKTSGPSYDAHTEYVYAPNQYYAQSFTTINDLVLNNRFYSITLFDGHDRVRATASDHPTSAGQYKAQYNAYDVMGRLIQRSNPTEINASWGPFGDDVAGWVWSYQAYDWQGRPMISTDQEGKTKEILYGGCGCAGGQVVVTRDEVGRRQKMTSDILRRLKTTQTLFVQPKEEPLNGNGTVYSTTTSTYNVRDQVTNVNVKDEATSVSQNTQMVYDGHGRLKERWLPIYLGNPQSATPYDSYEYFNDDTLKKVTDPRGASATYGYNNRHLVMSITYGVPSGVAATPNVTFGYDETGNRTSMIDGLGNVTYHYDTLSRMDWEMRYFNDLGQNYTLNYEYNLAGQLKKITDPLNASVNYVFNRAGEVIQMTGTNYPGVSLFASGMQYRAWGALKAMSYGNNVQYDLGYDARMLAASYALSNLQLQTDTLPPQVVSSTGSNYEYYADGRLKFASDLAVNNFDRKYEWDDFGRLKEAYSGREARGETFPPSTIHDNPYRKSLSYDVWGNLTGHGGWFWRAPVSDSGNYINNRRQFWDYDVAGNIVINSTGHHTYDAAGHQTFSATYLYLVGGGETGHPSQSAFDIAQSYDGQGQVGKRTEIRRTEELVGGGPQTNIHVKVKTTYYVRSSILGGAVITEEPDNYDPGTTTTRYVYAGGERLATVTTSWPSGQNYINWRHINPATGNWLLTDNNRASGYNGFYRQELDPLRAEAGLVDPYISDPDPTYMDLKGEEPLYIEGGDPFDLSGGCELDGLPIACSDLLRRVEVGAIQAVGPKGIAGDVIHLGGGLIFGRYGTGSHLDEEGDRVIDYQYFYGQVKQNKPIVRIDPLPNNEFIFKNRAYEKEFYDILYEFVTNQDCVDQYKRIGIDIVDLLTNPKRGIRIGPGDLFKDSSYKMLDLQTRLGLTDAGYKNAVAASGYSFNAYTIGRPEFLVEKSLPTILISATAMRSGLEHMAKTFSHELIHAAGIRGRVLSQAERFRGSIFGGPQERPNDLDHLNELDDIIDTCTRRFKR